MQEREKLQVYLDYLDKEKPQEINISGNHYTICEHNSKLIRDYARMLQAQPTEPGYPRIQVECSRLKSMSQMLKNKYLDKLIENDLIELNNVMRDKKMKAPKYYRKVLKRFLTLTNKKKYLDLIDSPYLKNVKSKANSEPLVDPDKFWNQEEISRFLKVSKEYSDRVAAFAAIWLTSGCRPGEILFICKKNIYIENEQLVIKVPGGKTGKRTIVFDLDESKTIWEYVEPHWKTLTDDQKLFSFVYNYAYRIHKKLLKRANIPKNKYQIMYGARKLVGTKFYRSYDMPKASSMFGHVQMSPAAKHYIALTDNDLFGKKPVRFSKRVCPNPSCGFENPAHFSHCEKCSAPLDREKFAEIFEKKTEDLLNAKLEIFKKELMLKKYELLQT